MAKRQVRQKTGSPKDRLVTPVLEASLVSFCSPVAEKPSEPSENILGGHDIQTYLVALYNYLRDSETRV